MNTKNTALKEQAIFPHEGTTIFTDDREIQVIAKVEEPLIVVLGNVLSDVECDQLIQLSKDRLQRSKIGNSREIDELRTSSSMFFEDGENEFIERIEKRVAQIMGVPVEHGDGLQILNYQIGQEYKAHYDYFTSIHRPVKNPRISTLVMYLNDVEEGGETYFPKLNFSVAAKKGTAVYFEYFYDEQRLNELTLHGGAPITKGDKWAATQWMRRKPQR
ncbi:2OG-Fe(II) oxygenase superfamily protein [Bacillus sp. THAF10]|nr:2OG-Fe(II) oxygenase superfamily protein [Bacillus sp. THAF10]